MQNEMRSVTRKGRLNCRSRQASNATSVILGGPNGGIRLGRCVHSKSRNTKVRMSIFILAANYKVFPIAHALRAVFPIVRSGPSHWCLKEN